MPNPKKPSGSMLRVLANLNAGREAHYGMSGRAAHGGLSATFAALAARGYIARGAAHGGYVITDAGRATLGVPVPDGQTFSQQTPMSDTSPMGGKKR